MTPIVVLIDPQKQTVSIWRDPEAAIQQFDEPTAWINWRRDCRNCPTMYIACANDFYCSVDAEEAKQLCAVAGLAAFVATPSNFYKVLDGKISAPDLPFGVPIESYDNAIAKAGNR